MSKRLIQKIREVFGAISPTFNTKINFLIKKKKLPNLKKPKTFDEKITWLKLYDYPHNELVSICSDKYRVREYVEKCGFPDILNDLLGVWDSPSEIDFSELPESFVIKWNHDYNSTFVVLDKNDYPLDEMVKSLERKGKEKFYLRASEMHYKNIEPKIIAEKLLVEPGASVLTDYKLYTYHGKVEYIMVCTGRDDGVKFYFFDKSWNFLRINKDGKEAPSDFSIPKPAGIDRMIEIAEILGKPFKYVRADFYLIEGKTYFGELTFTPASGMDANLDLELDLLFGNKLNLEENNE